MNRFSQIVKYTNLRPSISCLGSADNYGPSILGSQSKKILGGGTIASSPNGKATMVEHVLPPLPYGSATGCSHHRSNPSPRLEHASHLDHSKSLFDKWPDPLIYIYPSSLEAPLPFISSAPHDLSLVYPYLPPLSSLRDLKHHESPYSLPRRLLLYPRGSTIGSSGDSSRLIYVSQWIFAACTLGMAAARLHYTLHLPSGDPLNGGVRFYGEASRCHNRATRL